MLIYLAEFYWGDYDDKDSDVLYAGTSKRKAIKAIKEFDQYYTPYWGGVTVWEKGKCIDKIEVKADC